MVMEKLKNKKKLGEMLIEAGLIAEDKLEKAVEEHKKLDIKLGQYLVREGIVSSSQLVDV